MSARYVVGIDLGTTHTALAYAPLDEAGAVAAPTTVLQVPQLVAQGTVDARPLLPSFLYQAPSAEGPQVLPWIATRAYAVGEHARARAVDVPQRVVASAKSWLCHPSVDRRAAILPLGAPDDVEKTSPVEAAFRLLEHLVEAWDAEVAKGDPALALGAQEIVLTVPASFDPGARELTTEAAFAAGLEHLVLLEEPQAALYAWLAAQGDGWRKRLAVGDVVLVVDVGGGTTDFSVIRAVDDGQGNLELRRERVGDHLLLGGDNMDLLLAHALEQKLGKELDRWQRAELAHAARGAKEKLLAEDAPDEVAVAVAGRGSKLVGGTLRTALAKDEVATLLVEGFFPRVGADERPKARPRAGLQRLGLPYAADAAVPRHLAQLLDAGADGQGVRPTKVLFNGGVMKARPLRARVLENLATWFGAGAEELEGADLDLAVARGAAAYGLARRGRGVRIRGGTARAYYVGIEGAAPAVPGLEPPVSALCVAPLGLEEGASVEVTSEDLCVVVGEPERFRFFASARPDDAVGSAREVRPGAGFEELAPVEALLPAEGRRPGDLVPVVLRAEATAIGTLVLEALPTSQGPGPDRFRLELSVRESEPGTS